MSDYLYHPRFQMKSSDWMKIYYSDQINPFYNAAPASKAAEARYAWGRFWEVLDWYIQQPFNDAPTNLGYIKRTRRQGLIEDYSYYDNCAYWFDPAEFDNEYVFFEVTDNYWRSAPDNGNLELFYHGDPTDPDNYYCGAVEWIDPNDSNQYVISRWNYANQNFETVKVVNGTCTIQGDTCYDINGIANPIYDMYDDVIQGKRLYWKPWVYYIKRKLMIQREEEFT